MEVISVVAREFGVSAGDIQGSSQHRRITVARHAWYYLTAQSMPRPTAYPVRGGHSRPVRDTDGSVRQTALAIGCSPSHVRYAMHRIEDMRDDPEFDAKLARIEAVL